MTTLHICPLSALDKTLEISNARSMITLAGPGKSIARPRQISSEFLALEFNDIDEPREGLVEPNNDHVYAICDLYNSWDKTSPMILQCWMGVSRSTAAALIVCAAHNPKQDMIALARRLRLLSSTATPNPLMIQIADSHFGLGGTMIEGVKAIGRGADTFEGTPFSMELNP